MNSRTHYGDSSNCPYCRFMLRHFHYTNRILVEIDGMIGDPPGYFQGKKLKEVEIISFKAIKTHTSCEDCGSSDALTLYDDGHPT